MARRHVIDLTSDTSEDEAAVGSPVRKVARAQPDDAEVQITGVKHSPTAPAAPKPPASQDPVHMDAPFRLMKISDGHIPAASNQGCLGADFDALIQGPGLQCALILNFQFDLPWMLQTWEGLHRAKHLIICHGEREGRSQQLTTELRQIGYKLPGGGVISVHAPEVPNFGTHHSKAIFLQYERGLRLIIHTANMVQSDCTLKSQSMWCQDFPPKDSQSPPTSPLETSLIDYFRHYKMPAQMEEQVFSMVRNHDLSSARAALVASVPGTHHSNSLNKYGHMRVKQLLSKESLPSTGPEWLHHSHTALQCSSVGSLDHKWLTQEFNTSLCAAAGVPLGVGLVKDANIHFVWPTVQEVRDSLEGWCAGGSIPGRQANVCKDFLQSHFCRFGGETAGRQRAMPHVKTYARFSGQRLAWVMQGSHNLSKAAWGMLQKNGSQLKILSYELASLHLPSLEAAYRTHRHYNYSCTNPTPSPTPTQPPPTREEVQFWSLASMRENTQGSVSSGHGASVSGAGGSVSGEGQGASGASVSVVRVPVPLPYALPPRRYSGEDRPWVVDVPHPGRDVYGHTIEELYGP